MTLFGDDDNRGGGGVSGQWVNGKGNFLSFLLGLLWTCNCLKIKSVKKSYEATGSLNKAEVTLPEAPQLHSEGAWRQSRHGPPSRSMASSNRSILQFLWIWPEAAFLRYFLFIPFARESPATVPSGAGPDSSCFRLPATADGAGPRHSESPGLVLHLGLLGESCTHPEFYHHCVLLMLPAPRISYCCIFACWNSESPLDIHIKICSCDKSAPDPPHPHGEAELISPLMRFLCLWHHCSACFSLLTGTFLLTDCASVHFCYFESTLRRGTLSLSSLQVS